MYIHIKERWYINLECIVLLAQNTHLGAGSLRQSHDIIPPMIHRKSSGAAPICSMACAKWEKSKANIPQLDGWMISATSSAIGLPKNFYKSWLSDVDSLDRPKDNVLGTAQQESASVISSEWLEAACLVHLRIRTCTAGHRGLSLHCQDAFSLHLLLRNPEHIPYLRPCRKRIFKQNKSWKPSFSRCFNRYIPLWPPEPHFPFSAELLSPLPSEGSLQLGEVMMGSKFWGKNRFLTFLNTKTRPDSWCYNSLSLVHHLVICWWPPSKPSKSIP